MWLCWVSRLSVWLVSLALVLMLLEESQLLIAVICGTLSSGCRCFAWESAQMWTLEVGEYLCERVRFEKTQATLFALETGHEEGHHFGHLP